MIVQQDLCTGLSAIKSFGGTGTMDPIHPKIGKNVYIAPTSYVAGELTIGDDCTIMHHVTIRADVSTITIGNRVNVQDGTVIHTKTGDPLTISDDVGIGHRAVVHGRTVGPNTLIGIASVILDDCIVGADCLIAAGAVLTPGTVVPDGKVVMGMPAKVVRDVNDRDREYIRFVVENYLRLSAEHAGGRYPNALGC
jgi:carbonic anhydrase/acetyltransferase-like protein (isoleucine patch superfamily)